MVVVIMNDNKWRDFAILNNMSADDFSKEIVTVAQAVLTMELNKNNSDKVTITNTQHDGEYELIYRRVK